MKLQTKEHSRTVSGATSSPTLKNSRSSAGDAAAFSLFRLGLRTTLFAVPAGNCIFGYFGGLLQTLWGGKSYILQPLFGGFTKLHEPVLFAEFVASSGRAFQVMLGAKRLPANAGDVRDMGLIPGLGRSPEEGNVDPLQYSYLEKATERGAWQAIVQRVEKSWTPLRQFSTAWTGSRVSKLLNWRI